MKQLHQCNDTEKSLIKRLAINNDFCQFLDIIKVDFDRIKNDIVSSIIDDDKLLRGYARCYKDILQIFQQVKETK